MGIIGGWGVPETMIVLVGFVIPALVVVGCALLVACFVGRVVRKSRDNEKAALDKLARLKELHDGGVLTTGEYDAWKRDILERVQRR